jgi:antitoxin component of RelBE/YafQ-DinJ toxin-antitoxin module
MTTQVIFKIDQKLKDRAMKKAQNEGMPFASVLKLATRAYVEGQFEVGFISNQPFNAKTRREISQALTEIKAGKGLSPRFGNARDAMVYLKNA